jgi:hypothetical protein
MNGPATLALLGNTLLRTAITRNLVSFPAQIQPFMRRSSGDLQERIVQLYFVRGWSVRDICGRYGLSKAMTHKLLGEWRVRAVESGFIQEIAPGMLDSLAQEAHSQESSSFAPVYPTFPGLRNAGVPSAVPIQITFAENLHTFSAGSRV